MEGSDSVRSLNGLRETWTNEELTGAQDLRRGIPIELNRSGFCVLELRQAI